MHLVPLSWRRKRGTMWPMRIPRTALLYGVVGGVLIAVLRTIEYRFLLVEHSLEIYGGLVALIFSGVGIWLGLKLTKTKETVVVREIRVPVPVPTPVQTPPPDSQPFAIDTARLEQLGITPRELQILELMAEGLSTREIAERLFVSENTVKTHSSRVFEKLSAKRRTQAVQFAKAARIIA